MLRLKLRCYSIIHQFLLILQHFSMVWLINLFRMANHWNSFEGYCRSSSPGTLSCLHSDEIEACYLWNVSLTNTILAVIFTNIVGLRKSHDLCASTNKLWFTYPPTWIRRRRPSSRYDQWLSHGRESGQCGLWTYPVWWLIFRKAWGGLKTNITIPGYCGMLGSPPQYPIARTACLTTNIRVVPSPFSTVTCHILFASRLALTTFDEVQQFKSNASA